MIVFATFAVNESTAQQFVALEPSIPGVTEAGQGGNLSSYINSMFTVAIGAAAFLAVIMIAVGGFQYMSTDAISGKSEGREKITGAILGLLLILGSVILLQVINPNILNINLNIPGSGNVIPYTGL